MAARPAGGADAARVVAQARALLAEIEYAAASLRAPSLGAMLPRAEVRLRALLEPQRAEVVSVIAGAAAGVGDVGPLWRSLERVRQDCAPIFEECLAAVHGACARAAGVDGGICALADALLDELAHRTDVPWGRFTVLASGEFLGRQAELVRVRFPDTTVWSLPVAAHEFGHHVANALAVKNPDGALRHPVAERLRQCAPGRAWHHFHEHFADAFAVHVLGPAFVCTCVAHRFSAVGAARATDTHPAPAARVHALLTALRHVARRTTGAPAPADPLLDLLERQWAEKIAAVGDPPVAPAELTAADDATDDALGLLDDYLAVARFDAWSEAWNVADALSARPARPPARTPSPLVAIAGAWLARMQAPERSAPLEPLARALCSIALPLT